jgi:hypothetical protein
MIGIAMIALGLLMALGAWGAYRPDNPNEYYWISYRFRLPDGQAFERSWSADRVTRTASCPSPAPRRRAAGW